MESLVRSWWPLPAAEIKGSLIALSLSWFLFFSSQGGNGNLPFRKEQHPETGSPRCRNSSVPPLSSSLVCWAAVQGAWLLKNVSIFSCKNILPSN